MDGLMLGFAAREIDLALAGGRVDRITQPDDDLLIIHVRNQGQSYRLLLCATPGYTRLHLTQKAYENPPQAPMFCMLARKHLVGGRLLSVEQLYSDRLLLLRFSNLDELGDPRETLLYFEAMGKHSNLTLVQDDKILDAMRHVTLEMSRVRQMLPGLPFVMPPRQDKLTAQEATPAAIHARMLVEEGPLHRFIFRNIAGLGADSAQELAQRITQRPDSLLSEIDRAQTSQALATLILQIDEYAKPTLLFDKEGTPREALPFPYVSYPSEFQQAVDTHSAAIETLYFERDLRNRFNQRSAGLRRALTQAKERAERKLALLEEDVLTPEQAEDLRIFGELITAHLHEIKKGAAEVTLPDYYTGGERTITLDMTLSPAQNAQRYFKRYRKAHTARKLAAEQKQTALNQIAELEDALYFLEDATSSQEISEIKGALSESGLIKRGSGIKRRKKDKPMKPLQYTSQDGFFIRVGRNSRQNEALLKDARAEDLWLHAKDIPGSHVLITAGGQKVPEGTLKLAAQLAAYHSKARGRQTQVDYTLRRYVKKTPGAGPGQVHYTGEKSLVVSMTQEEFNALGQSG
ncbi:MAG: fibronectin/fibrinogen-binding protein [Clostridiales bacterium]|nr:fibronectin/fibrinogen-binding protein [Clostridiales bacterium]